MLVEDIKWKYLSHNNRFSHVNGRAGRYVNIWAVRDDMFIIFDYARGKHTYYGAKGELELQAVLFHLFGDNMGNSNVT